MIDLDETFTPDEFDRVTDFASLPDPTLNDGEIVVVENATGVWLVNRRPSGMYISDGVTWRKISNWLEAFSDTNFRIYNGTDNTKNLKWDVSAIAASTTRTITMPNSDVNLSPITGQFSHSFSQKPTVLTPVSLLFDTEAITPRGIIHSTTVKPEEFKMVRTATYTFIIIL